ncbi:hypothetical protein [Paraburkholderia sp.]|uniref:hypothetical protein n=1 Tax=Paraburkholderia sp. TaxID=1926495 RepID=UPI00345D3AEC
MWQFKAGVGATIAVLIVLGARWVVSADTDTDIAHKPGPSATPVPVLPAIKRSGIDPGPTDRMTQSSPPARPLPQRFNDYLAQEYANSAVTRQVLTQIAQGWSQAVNNVRDPQDAKRAGDEIAQGIACALGEDVLAKVNLDQQEMLDRIKAARAVMLDDESDTVAYLRFQSLAGGQFFDDPQARPCRFDPSVLLN